MSVPAFERLNVLVTGVDTVITRDVVRLAADEGARVTVADKNPEGLARLCRDVGLCRARIETATVDLGRETAVRTWEGALRGAGRLPQLIVCCCSAPHLGRGARRPGSGHAADVALSEQRQKHCPAALAHRLLSPTLVLHAEPLRRSVFDKAIAVLRHPTLRGVLERAPGRGAFDPVAVIPYATIAARLPSLARGAADPTSRLRLAPLPADRADAA